MKAVIKKVEFLEEKEGQYGMQYSFKIHYDGKWAYYKAKKKEQDKFVEGQECEFTEEEHESKKGNKYFIVKPIYQQGFSNFNRAVKKEQSRYSTMGTSYVNDLIVAGKIDIKYWELASEKIVKFMLELDRKNEN